MEAIARARKHDWKIAVLAGLIAIIALVVGNEFGNVHGPALRARVVVWITATILLVAGVVATRRSAAGFGALVTTRSMAAAGAAVRLVASGIGYLILICAELDVLNVSVGHLLVGAGVAGIVLGIAAQQSLSNVFAALVLLLAKPFVVGDHVRIRSGALGGVFEAVVLGLSLTYVTLSTDDGVLRVPNSVMLATAVGPIRPRPSEPAQ